MNHFRRLRAWMWAGCSTGAWAGWIALVAIGFGSPLAAFDGDLPQASGDAPVGLILSCRITGPSTCEVGTIPEIKVQITNQTDHEILLVGSLDGSDSCGRYPYCYFEVLGPNGKSAVKPITRCSFMNTLSLGDFVAVPSRKAFDPYGNPAFFGSHQLSESTFDTPGEYRIRFCYSTEHADPKQWQAWQRNETPELKKVLEQLARVPRISVESNVLELRMLASDD